MKHTDQRHRTALTVMLMQEAEKRGEAWLASVLRPTGCRLIGELSVDQMRTILENFYSSGYSRQLGVVSI